MRCYRVVKLNVVNLLLTIHTLANSTALSVNSIQPPGFSVAGLMNWNSLLYTVFRKKHPLTFSFISP